MGPGCRSAATPRGRFQGTETGRMPSKQAYADRALDILERLCARHARSKIHGPAHVVSPLDMLEADNPNLVGGDPDERQPPHAARHFMNRGRTGPFAEWNHSSRQPVSHVARAADGPERAPGPDRDLCVHNASFGGRHLPEPNGRQKPDHPTGRIDHEPLHDASTLKNQPPLAAALAAAVGVPKSVLARSDSGEPGQSPIT